MTVRFKYFYDSLNIVLLASDCEFFYAKCDQFPLTLMP